MMQKLIPGTKYVFTSDSILVRSPQNGTWSHKTSDKNLFTNIEELFEAIADVASVFQNQLGFEEISSKTIIVTYSENNPVYIERNLEIGIHDVMGCYEQYVYQFSHELMHFCMTGVFDKQYKWLEESICQLASIATMRHLYKKYVETDMIRAKKLFFFINDNSKEIVPELHTIDLLNHNRIAENTIAVLLYPYLEQNTNILSLFSSFPGEEKNFETCIEIWKTRLKNKDENIANTLKNIYRGIVVE